MNYLKQIQMLVSFNPIQTFLPTKMLWRRLLSVLPKWTHLNWNQVTWISVNRRNVKTRLVLWSWFISPWFQEQSVVKTQRRVRNQQAETYMRELTHYGLMWTIEGRKKSVINKLKPSMRNQTKLLMNWIGHFVFHMLFKTRHALFKLFNFQFFFFHH